MIRLPLWIERRERQQEPAQMVTSHCSMSGKSEQVNIAPIRMGYVCTRCGKWLEIHFPIDAQEWLDQAEAFAKEHKGCERKKGRHPSE